MKPILIVLLAAGGCAPSAEAPEPVTSLLRTVDFVREEADGISAGFDLDGRTSDDTDSSGCFIPDFTHPDGTQGIDNRFARILPAIENLGGAALEALVQAAVDSGELLLIAELRGLDDPWDDDCVDVSLLRGRGAPAIGSDGLLLPDQTFDRDLDAPAASVSCATLEGGVLRARPMTMRLPLAVFDEWIDLTLIDGTLEITTTDTGWDVMIGGGVGVVEIQDNVASLDGIGDDIPVLIETVLGVHADLAPNAWGGCDRISVTLRAEAVPAYLFPSEEDVTGR